VVGRSREFWEHFYPALQETFPVALGDASLDSFYRAVNKVEPSFIRVEADEVTYTLHIMLRFEMEQDLLNGTIAVENANEVWNERFEKYFGVRPPSDRQGILQDVHWSWGMFGYFPTYALGTVLSVQLFDTAVRAHPEIPEQIARGDFSTLHGWLTENLYRFGSTYEPNELIERATGRPLEARPYLQYITSKFGEIYGIGLPSTLKAAGGSTA
jgi:carboxypeptidase Taq